ncbi:Hypothetical protein A7982_05208 [Minicystis rosea]|nr:Hypothetical protein A7982_05208 [Minicystis rosea]
MATLLRKARRRALMKRWWEARRDGFVPDADVASDEACEIDPTPTPRPVTVELGPPSSAALPSSLDRFEPAARPPHRRFAAAFAAMLLLVAGVIALTGAPRDAVKPTASQPAPRAVTPAALVVAAPATDVAPVAVAPKAVPAGPRADAHINRDFYGHVPGGVLFVPKTFSSEDGAYDLYLHFHGNTRVVLESAEYAGLNAVVAVVNLGINSAPYLNAYEEPGSFERLLESVDRAVAERGLEHPHLRRLAVGSWSGGYGAVSRIFERGKKGTEKLDAALVLDGIHCGFLEENPSALNVRIIAPFLDAAKRAAQGDFLFSITHSEITPIGYAGTYLTAAYLLEAVHGQRGEPQSAPEHVQLRAAEGAVSKKLEKHMDPLYDATVGGFHVRGYRGNTPEHHMAHLLQMGATVMPELVARWSKP